MQLAIRKFQDQSIDEFGTIIDTIHTATMEESFSPEEVHSLLKMGDVDCTLRFVTRTLSTLSTHLGGFELVELRSDSEERRFARYTDERYHANKVAR